MDLYTQLGLDPVREEPDVWVRRLVIYKQIDPQPQVIRDIHLTRGLNIVWAEELEDDDPKANITGHSAGKTTFCRLLRYVLGERTYATKANMALIRKAFPSGYVGAELLIRGQLWSVIRPIGHGRNSYIKTDAVIEELLADRSHAAYQDDYAQKVGFDALLDDMEAGAVVRTDQPIDWNHVLAWCTRDQEARFQSIHDWRSARSESDWRSFRFAKADPLFVMRSVLGLFLPDELKAEEDLANLLKKQDGLEKRLEELKREPQFRVSLYDEELRRRLREILPDEPDIETLPLHSEDLLPDLRNASEKARGKRQSEIAAVEDKQQRLQDQIEETRAAMLQKEDELRQLATTFNLDSAALREIDAAASSRQSQRQQIRADEQKLCPWAGILIKDCDHVQRRHDRLRITALQDAHALEQAEAERTETRARLEKQKEGLEKSISQLREEQRSLRAERDALWDDAREKRNDLRDLQQAEEQLVMWTERQSRPGQFSELDMCQRTMKETGQQIEDTEERLSKLLEQHADNRDLLARIFSGSVKSVLPSGTYDGRVSWQNRELEFRITHGPAMSGEAVETLSVLLADVACLIYNSVNRKAHLPGFLLHDSPREADLGIRIYRSFIRFIAALQGHFHAPENCPFQYILTTTTPPPPEHQEDKLVKLKLNAAVKEGLLLQKNVADPPVGGNDRLI